MAVAVAVVAMDEMVVDLTLVVFLFFDGCGCCCCCCCGRKEKNTVCCCVIVICCV